MPTTMFRVGIDDESVLAHGGVGSRDVERESVHDESAAAPLLVLLLALALVAGVGVFVLTRTILLADDAGRTNGDVTAGTDEIVETTTESAATAEKRAIAMAQALELSSVAEQPYAYERPTDVAAEFERITEGLGGFTLAASVGRLVPDGDLRVVGPVDLNWTLSDGTVFATEGELRLVQVGPEWQVDWDPAVLHAGLTPGDVFIRERITSPRAPILGAGGFELVGERPVVEVGVITGEVGSIDEVSHRLAELLGIDGSELTDRLRRSPSDAVTTVVTRRPADIESTAGELALMPGVVLNETTAPLTPYEGYGRALLGWTGEVTAEILEQSPDYFAVGDRVGRSGLQAAYNERLAGLPGFRVRIDRRFPLRDGTGREIPADAALNIVHLSAPQPPQALRTTIDHRYQVAAEQALQATELPSSLVAVRVSSGEVLAVANGPGAAVENRALTGRYPPGSIFKVVTAYAALEHGREADQPIGCPASLVVDGKAFRNAETRDRGTVTLRDAFAYSCNTSFVELGLGLDADSLPRVARSLGIGAEYRLGTPAFSGSVPVPGSAVDQAATSFGQGRVLVSPLSVAVMAAAVADGTYRPPTLVAGDGAGAASRGVRALDRSSTLMLQEMMAAVVDDGTGQALKGLPGGRVHGKTGTAEFGVGDPPPAHAWFAGYQGDVAFAVVVDGGGPGGSVAAPIAADFLRNAAE